MLTLPRRAATLAAAAALALVAVAAPASASPSASPSATSSATSSATAGPELPSRLSGGVVVDPAAPALPGDLTAAAWAVVDLDSGQVLAAKDAHAQHAPASTLKVLTTLALLPEVPTDALVFPEQADIDVDGSKVGLLHGQPYPAEELYAALLMASGNDVANVLGTAAGGHRAAALLMNRAARAVGAVDTVAVNQSGLDAEGQLSTSYDLAAIGRAALAVPDIARWVATRRGSLPGRPGEPRFEVYNHNKLLGSYEGALGVKNGYTSRARASFIGAAERDGRRLLVTLMRAEPRVWAEAAQLLDWGFAATAAGARPVGSLPDLPAFAEPDEPPVEAAAAAVGEAVSGTVGAVGTAVETVAGATETTAAQTQGPTSLPDRQLAGALLVVAALVAVRPHRRPRARAA